MPNSTAFKEAKGRAENVIRNIWEKIALSHTLGWGGPIDSVERKFPFVREAAVAIRQQISADLPLLFFQSRESPPKEMLVAVPFWKDTGNPYNCRLAAQRKLSTKEVELYTAFAQAIWFSIAIKSLPDPGQGKQFYDAILAWTGQQLFEL